MKMVILYQEMEEHAFSQVGILLLWVGKMVDVQMEILKLNQ